MAKEYREGRSNAQAGRPDFAKGRQGKREKGNSRRIGEEMRGGHAPRAQEDSEREGTPRRWEESGRGHAPRAQEDSEGGSAPRRWEESGRGHAPRAHEDSERRRTSRGQEGSGQGYASGAQQDSKRGHSSKRQADIGQNTSGAPKQAEDKRTKKHKLCPVSAKCGGCRWINIGYKEQQEAKATRFRRLMEPYCKPEPLIPMEEPAHYRNKVHAVFGIDRKHNIISGIYEEKSHRIVPVDSCLIENQKADEIIVSIRGLLKSFKIRPYNEDTGYGLLRHVLVRVGHATGQIMVVLVLTSPVMPSKNNFVKALRQLHPEIDTIVVNVNDRDTSMVLGDKEQVIYGKGYIEDELCGMTFRISPRSFYQVNPLQTQKLYAKAMEYAGMTGRETVLDAYCGTGTIGLIAARNAKEVIGVELNKDAVRDAVSNAKRNGIANISFYQNDAGRFLLEMAEQSVKLDVLFMDPPRSGSDEAFLDAVARIRPERVVYISCNPETLVRDLDILGKKGYMVERCVAVDMFPFTESLEAVVALSRKPIGRRK